MAQPFAPPGIPSGNQPYAYQPQLLQRQREAQAMHPLSAAMAAGQPPSQAISDSHQQMQGMGGPGMPNAAGMPGAIPGAVGAGGPVGIPRSVGGGMMGPGQMGPNDQRAMSGQPGAGDVHPMGTGAHMNPHAQAMLQAQGHGMPPGYHNAKIHKASNVRPPRQMIILDKEKKFHEVGKLKTYVPRLKFYSSRPKSLDNCGTQDDILAFVVKLSHTQGCCSSQTNHPFEEQYVNLEVMMRNGLLYLA
ncbi:hypothetical protein AAP_01646 [Ascosphaera apis ARSEF 7405]|uniref:Uncharacterized protein n=1 Tax=Ascosphaera apis ARSEF 7405 TaxID=392613 RepID=A0A168BDG6_9EURO|nr:hypothetical protein AAP_01646 [Ascosphaera apis ARSEF 7405]